MGEGNRLLSKQEEKIIREQITKNSQMITRIIQKIDLLMNREGHRADSVVVKDLRAKLDILMSENDTFRKVFWRHMQLSVEHCMDTDYEAVRFLVLRIKTRNSAGLLGEYEVGTST